MTKLFIAIILLLNLNPVPIQTICYEARGESLKGQWAVASVIRQRAEERNKPFKAICLQPRQFSCFNTPKRQKLRLKALTRAYGTWLVSGFARLDANLYYNPAKCSPYWAKIPRVKEVGIIGNHKFMKE